MFQIWNEKQKLNTIDVEAVDQHGKVYDDGRWRLSLTILPRFSELSLEMRAQVFSTGQHKFCALSSFAGQFGGFEWSHAETYVLYIAEKKRPKAKSFFDKKAVAESLSKSKDELTLVRRCQHTF